MRVVAITDTTQRTLIGANIQVAETSLTRMVGLLGRRGLNAGEGLWIRPSSGVHTVGMKFPIDVVGLDKSMRVIKLWNELRPQRLTSVSLSLHSVIELKAGTIADTGIQLGDLMQISEVPSSSLP
jgi:uncharacterized membrane protein (UPF0127 family)